MRLSVLVLAALVISAPAVAQDWKEYTSPDNFFIVEFPGTPKVETAPYKTADGRSVPAREYSFRREGGLLRMTIAEVGNSPEATVLEHAIKTMAQGGEVKFNFPHRVGEIYGRQVSITGKDGSRTGAALFVHNGRLIQIEGNAPAGGNQSDVVFFTNSLIFVDKTQTNRTEEQLKSYRDTCIGIVNNPPVSQPAGLDDPRCKKP